MRASIPISSAMARTDSACASSRADHGVVPAGLALNGHAQNLAQVGLQPTAIGGRPQGAAARQRKQDSQWGSELNHLAGFP